MQYQSSYLSIDEFDPVDLPDFVVLTGVNGSGKSHLLTAIEKRNVIFSGMEQSHIVLFNYETFKLDNEPSFNAHQLASERESAWQFHEQRVKNNVKSWRSGIGDAYESIKEDCASEGKSLWSVSSETLRKYKRNFSNWFNKPNIKNNQQAQGLYALAKKLPYSIDEIEHDEFVRIYKPYVFKNDFLPNQLGKLFWDYFIKYRSNQVNEFENEKHGKNYDFLTEEKFIKTHGQKPWVVINTILRKFSSLQYEVSSPEGSDYFGNFQLKLRHTEKEGLEIDFNSLSSGEKVLMALVASVYKSTGDKHFPDILLLDEVDALLHPSMMKNMLEVIEEIFLSQGVKVVLVTHAPTTIALVPEGSVYIMNRSGKNRIEKKSRQ